MLRPSVAVVSIAIALAAAIPSFAQVQTPPPTGQTETQFINIPVYSSDGEHLGRVIEVAMSDGLLRGVRAEFGEVLGIGTATVLISAEILEQQTDRLEIRMTAGQVRELLAKQKQQTQ